ncbi:hypothetical protein H6G91_20665 [Nostoc muscorum FACHB-395]|nr:hypothetical protein [Desmonostoc muscorum FACHB-395]
MNNCISTNAALPPTLPTPPTPPTLPTPPTPCQQGGFSFSSVPFGYNPCRDVALLRLYSYV